ncbi:MULTISPECIES: GNAT family N-acetyltransferase [Trichocoleus]|uniref:GNAT family N-acetyltransferase n=1 Tax=Trichocoleus desertorum GB2-A4 TaxID=2933944 RepID=A0ABV0JGL2_9CYAN|nr:GNAT family N-acetyltransferase [Trichocoleus sp. FACHB-46]MBD1863055.1 GNAT family N-acetyltransferase [Trichocoleus sp. FACHB-46]
MIQPTTPDDASAIIALAVAAGMFPANETEALGKVLADYFGGNLDKGHVWVSDEEAGELCGAAYYAPDLMADRTWYLYMIAVRPDCQGRGHGTMLMQHVENALRMSGQRLLLVETSGLPNYERTRTFYEKCGYEKEARIRDFYTAGDDKIVFRKVLNAD